MDGSSSSKRPGMFATAIIIVVALSVGAAAGFTAGLLAGAVTPGGASAGVDGPAEHWTCSMHPDVDLPGPGKCPICFMDLIPVPDGGGEQVAISAAARELARIETAPVLRKVVEAEVRMAGKIDFDETRRERITAYFPGRLERLYVDYTGMSIRKGDHLAEIYSPELLAAQEELLATRDAVRRLSGGGTPAVRASAKATLFAAREKLRLWGLSAAQVASIENSKKPSDRQTLHASAGGVVVTKHVDVGSYVKTGDVLYVIADLSKVWLKLKAYESDLPHLRYGQAVTFTVEAAPGEVFAGTVTFIAPVVDTKTRTIAIRVVADNSSARLKPGMFVRATVRSRMAASGAVIDPSLANKWICPMHPEVIKDAAGKCDVCEMALVRPADMGLEVATEAEPPLVIPSSAPLVTGERAIVYVEVPGSDKPTYEARQVVLGPRAGDWYTVRSGLKEGERVVTKGAVRLDGDLQIRRGTSMMSPGPKGSAANGAPGPSPSPGPQTHCPVMGGPIDKAVFIDYGGKRIYFCCPGCDGPFRKDAAKYLKDMRELGVELEDAPLQDDVEAPDVG